MAAPALLVAAWLLGAIAAGGGGKPGPACANLGPLAVIGESGLAGAKAVQTAEAQQIGLLAAQICTLAPTKQAWPVLNRSLQLARLAAFAPPQTADVLRTLAQQTQAWSGHALARQTLLATAVWLHQRSLPLAGSLPVAGSLPLPAGQLAQWAWLGPFGAEHGTAFARPTAVENHASAEPALAASQPIRGRDALLRWQPLPEAMAAANGRIALHELVDRPDDALMYGQTFVRLRGPDSALATLQLGGAGATRVWLDGRLVLEVAEVPAPDGHVGELPPAPPVDVTPIALGPHWQRLLVKLAPTGAQLAFEIQIVDANGNHLPLETTATLASPDDHPAALAPSHPAVVVLPPVERDRAGALTGQCIAGLLQMAWQGWRLPASLQDELLNLPLAAVPNQPVLALAHANLPGEGGDRLARLQAWSARLPHDADLALAVARALDADGKSTQALRSWLQFRNDHADKREKWAQSVSLCLQQVRLYRAVGADVLADATLSRCAAAAPQRLIAEEVLRRSGQTANRLTPEAIALAAHLHSWASTEVLQAAMARGDWSQAVRQAQAILAALPGRTRILESIARARLEANAATDATAADQLLAQVPVAQRRTLWHELASRSAALRGDPKLAAALLQTAVNLSPQRSELRTRLRLLTAGRDFYAEHRRDLVALVQRERATPRKHPYEVRLRQTVLVGLGNGQQARYEAEVLYIGKDGPVNHDVDIDYAPSLSEAEVLQALVVRANGRIDRQIGQNTEQFGDDSNGLYFDLARLKLNFRNLKPGDAIVVEHELRDLGPAPFGLVFGELLPLGDTSPVREVDVAIRLPTATPLHYALYNPAYPQAPQPAPAVRELAQPDGSQLREWRWKVGPFAPAVSEPRGPNAIERVAVLHASSFGSWAQAADWFGLLLREALPEPGADPVIRELAQRLGAAKPGAAKPTVETQVRAVYEFARAQVRYVGLEFGIHSIKPHAAQQVAQRQFGDCKDKATLIVALLAELGIPAQVALVRTSDLGQLRDGVASLGIFNHAIAYVPQLDWWLDATAVPHGPLELPEGDASGMALRIVEAAHVQTLPDPRVDREASAVTVDLRLDADGAASMLWRGRFAGLAAAQLRGELAGAANKKEKLEQELAPRWPGIAVTDVSVAGVEPQTDVVTVAVTARLPKLGTTHQHRHHFALLRPAVTLLEAWAPLAARQTTLVLPRPIGLHEVVTVHLPTTMRVVTLPSAVQASGPAALFTVLASVDGSKLMLSVDWRVSARHIAVGDYGAFRSWLAQLDAAVRAEVVVETAQAMP